MRTEKITVERTERYVINGKEYHRLEDVPPRERKQIERMLEDRDGDGIPDVFQLPPPTSGVASTRTSIPQAVVVYTYLAVFILALVSSLTTFHFLPSAAFALRMQVVGIAVPLALLAPIVVLGIHRSTSWRERMIALAGSAFMFVLFRDGIVSGVPPALHRISNVPAEVVVTVFSQGSRYSKYCHHNADVHHPEFADETVCGLDESVSKPLALGDQLKLSGSRSDFGFAYDPYRTQRIPAPALEK